MPEAAEKYRLVKPGKKEPETRVPRRPDLVQAGASQTQYEIDARIAPPAEKKTRWPRILGWLLRKTMKT